MLSHNGTSRLWTTFSRPLCVYISNADIKNARQLFTSGVWRRFTFEINNSVFSLNGK